MTITPLRDTILSFFRSLETLAEEHEELTEADVRETLHETLNFYFVWDQPIDRLPVRYRMFSEEADRALAAIVATFLKEAKTLASAEKVSTGQARLDLIQDPNLEVESDLYIGYAEEPLPLEPLPQDLFEPGDYDADD